MKVAVRFPKKHFRNNSCCFSNWCRSSRKNSYSSTTTLIIGNKGLNDIMKIIQALVYSNILRKGIMKTTENETKELEGGF